MGDTTPNEPIEKSREPSAVGQLAEIECRGIDFSFENSHGNGIRPGSNPSAKVLDHLELSVRKGSVVTLLGSSGCGKSTLLRMVAKLLSPSAGEIWVRGVPSRGGQHVARSRPEQFISFVFQEAALLPWRTVWENVLLPHELRGTARTSEARDGARHWLRTVGLAEGDWRKKPSSLSGGMKMRASIARAMTTEPTVLLMDEPFAALDDVLRSRLNDLILQIVADRGCTVLFVTHNIAEAVYLSDEIAVMAEGRIVQKIPISFESPRSASLRGTTEFAHFYGEASDILFRSASNHA